MPRLVVVPQAAKCPGQRVRRLVVATGVVTTVVGLAGISGSDDGGGGAARLYFPIGVAVDLSGNLWIGDSHNNTVRLGVPSFVPTVLVASPAAQHVSAGSAATLTVTVAGRGLTYQWKKDGVPVAGATGATYTVANATGADMGFFSAVVAGSGGSVESGAAVLTVATRGSSRLANLSTRAFVPAGGDLTVGFALRGSSGAKSLLIRAVGPTLGTLGVDGSLADPRLDVIPAGAGAPEGSNDDWGGGVTLANAFAGVGAFALPANSKDAALLASLAGAGYTARITSSITGGAGIAIAEVYDRDARGAPRQLVNVSTRGFVGNGSQALVPGFVIDGDAPKQLLIRAVGPGLAQFGVGGTLADPQLTVIPLGQTFAVASNDNWDGSAASTAAFAAAGAFALPPASKDAALIITLVPGNYTVQVSGANGGTGIALVEAYDLPSN